MVNACRFAKFPKTFAALPVGARRMVFMPTWWSVFTSAAVTDVLPVPAYPLRRKMERGEALREQKRDRAAISFSCCPVGVYGKLPVTLSANSATVMEWDFG